ncbi:MAG: helix-turn-helix domain-containing protein [SAR324 cluster bacterium]|nr:helix-turn-helix domain-containing protein [SAR324 cluster bacterium]
MPKKKITVNSPQKEKFIPQEEEFVPQEEESLQQLGQKIREARIAKNLSLESVSGHLHIAVKILEAIEEGKPEKGPSPVFLRGLVRTYCHYLGIDKTGIADKIEQFLKSADQGKQQLKTLKPVLEIRESHPIRNIVTVLVLVTGGYLFYLIYSSQIPFFLAQDNNTQSKSAMVAVEDKLAENEKIIVTDDGIVTSPQSVKQSKQEPAASEKFIPEQIEASGETSSVEDSNLVKTDTTGESNTTPDTVTEKTETDDVLAATDRTSEKLEIESEISLTDPNQTNLSELSQSEVEQDLMQPLTLEVEASEGTWISISVDGNEAKDIRLGTDEIHQWEAKKEYLLTLGNTHSVRILLNGREIETNRTHQLLTDWVIDKSFLP